MTKNKTDGRVITAAILIAAGLLIRFLMNGYEFIAYTLWAVALAILYFRILKFIKPKHPKLERILNKLASYGIILLCMIFAITEGALIYGVIPEENVKADYAVVLGAGINGTEPSRSLEYRLEAAAEYLKENPDTVCIVSGCQGPNEIISEAECMYTWLIANGIDEGRIIKEDHARNTKENITNSIELIEDDAGKKPESVAIITEHFHMTRAALIAENMGVKPVCVEAQTELPLLRANNYIREALAMWKYLIFK